MPIKLTDLLQRVAPEVESRIKRVRDQVRSVLQESLRTECRLVMRTPDESEENRSGAYVRVEVAPGYPATLEEVSFPDDLDRILLLGRYRSHLTQAIEGVTGLIRLKKELLLLPSAADLIMASDSELASTADWAIVLLHVLDENDPLKSVLAVRDDFLGIYECGNPDLFADEYATNRATIVLYWGVIGLIADWMGCTVEDLAIVVLTHELAHAYTQLGADIDGRRWAVSSFARAETGLKEGLAQYYTERVLRRLERRYAGALKVYLAMLPGQPEAYRSHMDWVADYSPEAVRRAMLEVRRWGEGRLEDFNRRLKEAEKELH